MLPEHRTKDGSSVDDVLLETPKGMAKRVMYPKRRATPFTKKCDQSAQVRAVKSRRCSKSETDRLNGELIVSLKKRLKKARVCAAQQCRE